MKKLEITIMPTNICNLETIRAFMLENPESEFMVEMDVNTIDYLRERIEVACIIEKTGFKDLAEAVNCLAEVIGGKK